MFEGPNLSGKTAIVTGASGTLGASVASCFFHCGGNVVLADRGGERLYSLGDQLAKHHADGKDRVLPVAVDLDTETYAENIVAAALEKYRQIDTLITAAGVLKRGRFTTVSSDEISRMEKINYTYAVDVSRAVIPHMAHGGTILHIASLSAHTGRADSVHYAAQKGALVAFTKSLAMEFAPHIRANCLSPGFVRSPLADQVIAEDEQKIIDAIPMKRFGLPEEIARAAVFLCSDWSSYVTGQVLHVNGGQYTPG